MREEEILQAALACFARFGMQKTTLQDVADAAGLSRATVYRYFPDRAVLIEAVTTRAANDIYEQAAAAAARCHTLEEQIAAFVEVQVRVTIEQRARARIRAFDSDDVFLHTYLERVDESAQTRARFLAPYVEAARARGELRPDVTDAEVREWISVAMCSMIIWPSGTFFDAEDPASISRFFARNICRGIIA